ncbi:hypothetical protein P4240_19515 [Bacillus thuringiensis]|nr:hypothetical protein [Bacillus thuringiensis]
MFRIKIKMKKGGKPSLILLAAALFSILVADITDNAYIKAASVVFTTAVIAAELTEMFLNRKKRREGDK